MEPEPDQEFPPNSQQGHNQGRNQGEEKQVFRGHHGLHGLPFPFFQCPFVYVGQGFPQTVLTEILAFVEHHFAQLPAAITDFAVVPCHDIHSFLVCYG